MVVENEKINPCTVRLTVEVGQDQVQEAIETAKRYYAKQLRVPGFRPGKAPVTLVDQFIQKDVLLQRAAEYLVPKAYQDALKEAGLEPYGAPAIELTQMDEENPARFIAKVPLEPNVTIGDYTNLAVTQPDKAVNEEEIERELTELRRRNAKQTKVDRGAEDGDLAVLVVAPEGEAPKRFMVIVGQTFPQLDQDLRGMSAGDKKNITVTFPADFEEERWAGKPMDCEIEMVSVSTVELPEPNDAFALEVYGSDMETLRRDIRVRAEALKEASAENAIVDQLWGEVLGRSNVDIPDNMWESVAQQEWKNIEQRAATNETTVEGIAGSNGLTVDQLREHVNENAKTQVKRALLIRDIAKQEGLELTQEDIDDQVKRLARRANISFEAASREIVKQNAMDEMHFRALFKKVTNLLRTNAGLEALEDVSTPESTLEDDEELE